MQLGPAEEIALHIRHAGVLQQLHGLLVADPFADGDNAEVPGEIDERPHEHLVFRVGAEILDERAVDLDHVDAELAQRPERGVAGAEIVERHAAAELLQHAHELHQHAHELHRRVYVGDRRGLGDLDGEPLQGRVVLAGSAASQPKPAPKPLP
jgi:hypothetical protein